MAKTIFPMKFNGILYQQNCMLLWTNWKKDLMEIANNISYNNKYNFTEYQL